MTNSVYMHMHMLLKIFLVFLQIAVIIFYTNCHLCPTSVFDIFVPNASSLISMALIGLVTTTPLGILIAKALNAAKLNKVSVNTTASKQVSI